MVAASLPQSTARSAAPLVPPLVLPMHSVALLVSRLSSGRTAQIWPSALCAGSLHVSRPHHDPLPQQRGSNGWMWTTGKNYVGSARRKKSPTAMRKTTRSDARVHYERVVCTPAAVAAQNPTLLLRVARIAWSQRRGIHVRSLLRFQSDRRSSSSRTISFILKPSFLFLEYIRFGSGRVCHVLITLFFWPEAHGPDNALLVPILTIFYDLR